MNRSIARPIRPCGLAQFVKNDFKSPNLMRFVVIVSQKYRTLTATAIPKIWDFVFRNNYKRCQLGIPLHR
jgi:hypothetical protein